jgi:hypothetical protein
VSKTVLDAREVAAPMVVTWFAKSKCLDGSVWVGVTEDRRWLDRSPMGVHGSPVHGPTADDGPSDGDPTAVDGRLRHGSTVAMTVIAMSCCAGGDGVLCASLAWQVATAKRANHA